MTGDPLERRTSGLRVAETEAERIACYALRYRVFIEELGFDIPTADHERKLEHTPEDSSAAQLYVSIGAEVIATMRLHHGSSSDLLPHFREGFELLHRLLPDTPIHQMVSIGRLAVDPRHRGGSAIAPLFQGVVRVLEERHPTTSLAFIFAVDEPKRIALFQLLGFQPLYQHLGFQSGGPEMQIRVDIGVCVPLIKRILIAEARKAAAKTI
jgi:predicted GNAT family N-acyltransferase